MNLNERQKEAANHKDGPLLVLAGAGSGKTATMVERTAILIEEYNVRPEHILFITFTVKAAREMKTRTKTRLGKKGEFVTVSNFHSFCSSLLRREIRHIEPYNGKFSIFDADDSKSLVKQTIRELELDEKKNEPLAYLGWIEGFKHELVSPSNVAKLIAFERNPMSFPDFPPYIKLENAQKMLRRIPAFLWSTVLEVYKRYQRKLELSNAVDFNDLIFLTVRLFAEQNNILGYYQDIYRYIQIDEYQDTNHSQYILARLLSAKYRNIAVVGDDYQGIYGFRNATISNILDFKKDYSEAKIVLLERNYRSTQKILDVANKLIQNNKNQHHKTMWTDKKTGEDVEYHVAFNANQEARYIVDQIQRYSMVYKYNDVAILYRINAQSRLFEEELIKRGIPYSLVGGTNFYQRKEIKDIIAYLRVILNPHDNLSLGRIINAPKRGIGNTTLEKIAKFSKDNDLSLWSSLERVPEYLNASTSNKINSFLNLIKSFQQESQQFKVGELIEIILEDSLYRQSLENENTPEAEDRLSNLQELLNVAWEYQQTESEPTLEGFLERVALIQEASDSKSEDETVNRVTLMTIHASKGLEFPSVYLAGVEENLLPYYKSIDEGDVEEERRLGYVAMTRAESKLTITRAIERMVFNKVNMNEPSRFLYEIGFEQKNDVNRNPFELPW